VVEFFIFECHVGRSEHGFQHCAVKRGTIVFHVRRFALLNGVLLTNGRLTARVRVTFSTLSCNNEVNPGPALPPAVAARPQ
jgi:hypothetical protein